MKKIIALIITLILSVSLVSCNSGKKTIGIIQFGSHESLNNCYEGVKKGLEESGINLDEYNIEYVNSNFDASVSQSRANTLVNKGASVIIAIATPSAVATANAAADSGIPVVYCAVTDSSVMDNFDNITGSSDVPNFEKQLEVVTAFMAKDKAKLGGIKVGVLYSTEESSSPFMVKSLKTAAEKFDGVEIIDSAVSDITTIDSKVNELIDRGVDCFVNILDNTIVGKLQTNILPITNEKKIPVFGSEIEQVKVGCVASASIEYIEVGKNSGKAAASVLKGEKKANDIPVSTITDPKNYYNSDACKALGIEIPSSVTATDVAK